MISSRAEPGGLIAVRRGALGDTVLFLPVLQALRRAFPGESLCFAGHGEYLEPVRRWAGAELVRSVEGWPPLRELYSGSGPPGPLPAAWRGARKVLLEWDASGDWGPVRLFDPRPDPLGSESITRLLLRRTGLLDQAPWPPEPLSWSRVPECAFLHPGAGARSKRWPLEAFVHLGRELSRTGLPVTILFGPVEREQGVAVQELAGLQVRTLVGLEELLSCLGQAALYVGNDSGPTHLAAALGIPTLALFGPTDPAVWGPPWPAGRVLRAEPLSGLALDRVLARALSLLDRA